MLRALFPFLTSLAIVAGCATHRPTETLPVRIGLVADSQITSPNSTPESLYHTVALDRRVECAIRPPALEHLTAEMLAIALRRFPSDTDFILYLGDGANSGGQDEISRFFQVLRDYREETGIPIFVVIGNHDYLGAGNTPNMIERFLILNRLSPTEVPPLSGPYNRPLSKYEVLKQIAAFNRQSSELPAAARLKYTDNAKNLDPDADHATGLYLAGYLAYPKQDEPVVEVFLADTSDYVDTSFKPEIRIWDPFVPAWDVYGMQGSISFRDGTAEDGRETVSQMTCLAEWAEGTSPAFRFIASHYHPDNLDRKRRDTPETWRFELLNFLHGTWETVCAVCLGHRYANQKLQKWLCDNGNYWLSGHTHRATMMHPGQGKVHVGGLPGFLTDASFRSVNVGSTTDYRAHIGIIEPSDAQEADRSDHIREVDDYVQFREIPLFDGRAAQERHQFTLLLRAIETYGRTHKHVPHCVPYQSPQQFGFSLLGLNKDYQDSAWTTEATETACGRLDHFIDSVLSKHPDMQRTDVVRYLAFIASACEKSTCLDQDAFDLAKCRIQ